MVRIMLLGPAILFAATAAAATPLAFVATIIRSHSPASLALVVAFIDTVLSPLAPSTRKPLLFMAEICSSHVSIAQTSFPESANNAA